MNYLKKLFYKTGDRETGNSKYPKEIKIFNDQRAFLVQANNELEEWRAQNFFIKEPETINWLENNINDNSVFWDIGSNIGLFSIYAAKINENIAIGSFEPEALNYSSLCKNIYINKIECIDPFCLALNSCALTISDLYISEMLSGCASHNLGSPSAWAGYKSVFKQKSMALSPDVLVSQFGLKSPTMLKIDVDGLEINILKGASKMLEKTVKTVILELDAHDKNSVTEMTSFLRGKNYQLIFQSSRTAQLFNKLPRNYIWSKHN